MKRFLSFLVIVSIVFAVGSVFAWDMNASDTKSLMHVENGSSSASDNTEVSIKDNFLKTIQVYLVSAYALIAVGMFIFIGFRLFNARGNEQEFKQAWVALAYTIVGLSLAPLAFLIVRIVTGFSIS